MKCKQQQQQRLLLLLLQLQPLPSTSGVHARNPPTLL